MRHLLTLVCSFLAIAAGATPGPTINGNQINSATGITISTLVVTGAQGLVVKTTGTVQGNAFSVGASTFAVKGGSVAIGNANPISTLDVYGSLSIGSGTARSTFTAGGTLTMGSVLNMSSNRINNVTDPSSAQDAATKAYVDASLPVNKEWTTNGVQVYLSTPTNNAIVQSTLTVQGAGFSVGASTFVVSAGSVAVGASAPSSAANFWVNGAAQFGQGTNISTFTAAGALSVPGQITGNAVSASGGQHQGGAGVDVYLLSNGGVGGSQIRLETASAGHIYISPQSGRVGINQLTPLASLEVDASGSSANYGIAPPQMTTTQIRNTQPAMVGMIVWNSTLAALCVSTGTATSEAYGLVSSPTTKCE